MLNRKLSAPLVFSPVVLASLLAVFAGCDNSHPEAQLGLPTTTLTPSGADSREGAPEGDQFAQGQPVAAVEDNVPSFTQEQLEQLVAPIALYPDPLLMEILMAATYPAEVAEAAVWRKQNASLNGKELDAAIADKGWDVSVNSLTHATQALDLMAADPQWTRDLGDAFLAQQDDVLNAVQVMRVKACDLGNLKTTEQQQVIIEEAPAAPPEPNQTGPIVVQPPQRIVRVVPVQPELIYVPVYNPLVIYGPPPPVIFYPGVYPAYVGVAPVITFGVGLAIGSWLWGDCDWHNHHVYRYHGGYYGGGHYHRRHYNDRYHGGYYGPYGDGHRGGDYSRAQSWRHDSSHRRDVNYRSRDLERTYRASAASRPQGRDSIDGRGSRRGPRGDTREGARRGRDGGGEDGTRQSARSGTREGGKRDSGTFDRRRGDSRDGGGKDAVDKPRGGSQNRGPGDSRDKSGKSAKSGAGKAGTFDGKSSKSTDRIDNKSRDGAPKSSAVAPRGPSGKGSSGNAPSRDSVKPSKPSKSGGGSANRPPSSDRRGGSGNVQRGGDAQRGGSSMQRGGNNQPSRSGSVQGGKGGSAPRSGSMQGGGGGGNRDGGSSKGGGGQQRSGGQKGGSQQRSGSNDKGGGGGGKGR